MAVNLGIQGQDASGFWDTQTVVEDVPKGNRGEIIRVSKVIKDRRVYVDVRNWFIHSGTQVLTPGKGIAIPMDAVDAVLEAAYRAVDAS